MRACGACTCMHAYMRVCACVFVCVFVRVCLCCACVHACARGEKRSSFRNQLHTGYCNVDAETMRQITKADFVIRN